MATSGVKVRDDCRTMFEEMKLKQKYKYIVYGMNKDDTMIEPLTNADEDNKNKTYEDFCNELPDTECRYGVFDLHFDLPSGGRRNKLVFYMWAPEGAKVKNKMLYASSKETINKALVGIAHNIQATERSELEEQPLIDLLITKIK